MTLDQVYQRALEHHQAGRLHDAELLYRQILQAIPNQPDVMHMLGAIAQAVGQFDAALELISQAIELNPALPGAWSNLGEAYRMLGRSKEAIHSYNEAIARDPRSPEPRNNLGIVLDDLGRYEEAIESYHAALRLRPNFAECHNNLGNALGHIRRYEEAILEYRKCLEWNPGYAAGYNNIGTSLEHLERYAEAEASYRRAVKLQPQFVEAWNNLGSLIRREARFDEAMECFTHALSIDPKHAGANWNAGLIHLMHGDFEKGWEGYEQRWRVSNLPPARGYPQPQWDGSLLHGKTLFVHAEQGFGDVIQAARYLPMLANYGGRVILEASPEMIDLLRDAPGVEKVVVKGEALPEFDFYIPIFSLPRVLKTRLDTIPTRVPYLTADSSRAEKFREILSPLPGRRVGLIWAGKKFPDPLRSIDPQLLSPLATVAGVSYVSLQKGESSAADVAPGLNLFDLAPQLESFADTAAAMNRLDLILTIDTGPAHLAGALGRPTWVMIPFAADWRWMLGREDSPWYPTMRLFRQPAIGDWKSLIDRVVSELAGFVQSS